MKERLIRDATFNLFFVKQFYLNAFKVRGDTFDTHCFSINKYARIMINFPILLKMTYYNILAVLITAK